MLDLNESEGGDSCSGELEAFRMDLGGFGEAVDLTLVGSDLL